MNIFKQMNVFDAIKHLERRLVEGPKEEHGAYGDPFDEAFEAYSGIYQTQAEGNNDGRIWTDKEGRGYTIDEISVDYAKNIVKFCERCGGRPPKEIMEKANSRKKLF